MRTPEGQLRASEVIAELRDLTRYRKKLVEEHTREVQRLQKVLEDACVKLDSVVTDVTGKAARNMIEALIAGERDPVLLAEMALTRMRPKIPELRRALWGASTSTTPSWHGCTSIAWTASTAVAKLDAEVDRVIAPFSEPPVRLHDPGRGPADGRAGGRRVGVDMSRFPDRGHLASWAGLCPGNDESAGKRDREGQKG